MAEPPQLPREDGSQAGTFRQVFTLTDLGSPFTSTFECTGSIVLKDGTIAMRARSSPPTPSRSPASPRIRAGGQ